MFSDAETITRHILERQANAFPDEAFVSFEDGASWTRAAALRTTYAAANALRKVGVRQGDRVGIMYRNGPEYLRAWWGSTALGASIVPIHTAYRGSMLEHLLRLSRPSVVVGEPELMRVFDELPERDLVPARRLTDADLHGSDITAPALDRPIRSWDTQAFLLTSGTTGPSKLADCSYRNILVGGCSMLAPLRGNEDVLLLDIPLFHGAAFRAATACLSTGVRMAIRSTPRLSNYWEVLKDTRATMSILISSMSSVLLSQPPRAAEREHRLRVMLATPLPADIEAFKQRFGIPAFHALYGSTEVPGSIRVSPDDVLQHGYCGRLQPGYECRIVDDNDIELARGTPGELIVRHEQPWVVASAYVDNPAATAAAWRNGWFHTGDMLRHDPDGRFFFVDRVKDSLRRRGENISSAEVEVEVMDYPGILEAACVPCRPEGCVDDEVKVWIVSQDGQDVDYQALLRFCAGRLPYFMVPRYFERIGSMPRTHNEKIRKVELRQLGNSERTWDREEHGLHLSRTGLTEDVTADMTADITAPAAGPAMRHPTAASSSNQEMSR